MSYIAIVILVLISASIAVHLELTKAILLVLNKVLKCHKCLTFWGTLIALYIAKCPILLAICLSLLNSYMSNWLAIVLVMLVKEYENVWHALSKLKEKK